MTDITDFSLEQLIEGRKLRTHGRKLSNTQIIDEIIAIYNKYYLPEIGRLIAEKEKARQEQKEKDANLVYTYALQAGASSHAYVTFTESKHLLAIAQEIWES